MFQYFVLSKNFSFSNIFLIRFSPSPGSSSFFPLHYTLNFVLSLSLCLKQRIKQQQQNQSWNTKSKIKKQKTSKTKKLESPPKFPCHPNNNNQHLKQPIKFICVGWLFLGMGPALEWVDVYPVTPHWRKPISFCQQAPITENFLVRDGSRCLLPCLSAGTSSGLNLCWSCVCNHTQSLWFHMCISPLVLGRHCFLWSHHLCLL